MVNDRKHKASKTAVKAAKKEAQERKAAKKNLKAKGCQEGVDIASLIAEIQKKGQSVAQGDKATSVLDDVQGWPNPRNAGSLTVTGSDLVLFGGEYYDGNKVRVFKDTFRLNFLKAMKQSRAAEDEAKQTVWRELAGGVHPPPRCSHQAVAIRDSLFVFGGEFATVEQFHHYNDLWRLDLKTWQWSCVKTTGTMPSPRSGPRMVYWRNHFVVFGGFYDTVRETRFFNDIYWLSLSNLRWSKATYPAHAHVPSPRSGVVMATSESCDGILVHGGYTKLKDTARNVQARSHNDSWWLHLTPILKGHQPQWEKLTNKGSPPSTRSCSTVAVHKQRAIVFGGVYDEDDGGLQLRSVFFNDVHVFDFKLKRWFNLNVQANSKATKGKNRKDRAATPSAAAEEDEEKISMKNTDVDEEEGEGNDDWNLDDNDDLNEKFAYIDENGKLVKVLIKDVEWGDTEENPDSNGSVQTVDDSLSPSEEEDDNPKNSKPSVFDNVKKCQDEPQADPARTAEGNLIKPLPSAALTTDTNSPLPRINALMAVVGSDLVVYGGLVEIGTREVTLDDLWVFNLVKRNGWECVHRGTIDAQPWHSNEDEDSSSEDEGSGNPSSSEDSEQSQDGSGSENSEDEGKGGKARDGKKRKPITIREKIEDLQLRLHREVRAGMEELLGGDTAIPDSLIACPEVGEKQREYFNRTKEFWTHAASNQNNAEKYDEKEKRRVAFNMAKDLYDRVSCTLYKMTVLEEATREDAKRRVPKRP